MHVVDALTGLTRVFLDTAPIIYHVEGHATYQAVTDIVFQRIGDGVLEGVTSSITLAECLVHPYRQENNDLVRRFRSVITTGAHTHYVGVDAVVEHAAQLRACYNLTLTDAFQVAAALVGGCQGFLTNDLTLKRVRELTILVLDELEPSPAPTAHA